MKYKQNIPQVKNVGFNNNFHYQNKVGLDKAYASENATYIKDDTMYIAGTRNLRDVYDDITKLPFGLTKYSDRYKQADDVLKDNPNVTKLVGHSLSSAVSDELRKAHPDRNLEIKAMYGSPFVQTSSQKHENRFRHSGDLISMFDRGSKTVDLGLVGPLKSHGYDNY